MKERRRLGLALGRDVVTVNRRSLSLHAWMKTVTELHAKGLGTIIGDRSLVRSMPKGPSVAAPEDVLHDGVPGRIYRVQEG